MGVFAVRPKGVPTQLKLNARQVDAGKPKRSLTSWLDLPPRLDTTLS
mgnify:CR=1 FL=1